MRDILRPLILVITALAAMLAVLLPLAAEAQDVDVLGDDDTVTASDEAAPRMGRGGARTYVQPYIEAAQVLTQELSPGDDTVTYTSLAAGVDLGIAGRNSAGSLSLRYERRFGWTGDSQDGDTLSGVARVAAAVVPRAVTIEAGALAARTRLDGNGAGSLGGFLGNQDTTSQVYAVYAGPSVHTQAGDIDISGHYLFGYTRVEAPDAPIIAPGAQAADLFDDGTIHSAAVRLGTRPNTVLPIGVGVGAGWNRQDLSNLDQRIDDKHVRADVVVPLSPTIALTGGVGYEDVEVSSRDVLRDAGGLPVLDSHGRFVTDTAAPRQIAYETDGLIWDVGVMWRPSRRTSFSGYFGRRYGSDTFGATFSYAPDARSSLQFAAYDNLSGFGGAVIDQLAGLPAEFDVYRNPITGEIGGCVAGTGAPGAEGNPCLAGVFGSIRSAVFRSRGVAGSYALNLGRTRMGIGAGFNRRKFIAATGTILGSANGLADDTVWLAAYAQTRLDELSTLSGNAGVNWFDSDLDAFGSTFGYTASLAYSRRILTRLSGTAAVGLDGITRDSLPDAASASALLGLRYAF